MRTAVRLGRISFLSLVFYVSICFTAQAGPPVPAVGDFAVLMSTGAADPAAPPLDGLSFLRDVRNMSDADIDASRQHAISFFQHRFGVDPTASELQNRVILVPFELSRDFDYRMYATTAARVPSNGIPTRVGGWVLAFLDPNGVALGGQFAGTTAPAGTFLVFGWSVINPTRFARGVRNDRTFEIQLKSISLPAIGSDGSILERFEIYSPRFGTGEGRVSIGPRQTEAGFNAPNYKTVMHFSN